MFPIRDGIPPDGGAPGGGKGNGGPPMYGADGFPDGARLKPGGGRFILISGCGCCGAFPLVADVAAPCGGPVGGGAV